MRAQNVFPVRGFPDKRSCVNSGFFNAGVFVMDKIASLGHALITKSIIEPILDKIASLGHEFIAYG